MFLSWLCISPCAPCAWSVRASNCCPQLPPCCVKHTWTRTWCPLVEQQCIFMQKHIVWIDAASSWIWMSWLTDTSMTTQEQYWGFLLNWLQSSLPMELQKWFVDTSSTSLQIFSFFKTLRNSISLFTFLKRNKQICCLWRSLYGAMETDCGGKLLLWTCDSKWRPGRIIIHAFVKCNNVMSWSLYNCWPATCSKGTILCSTGRKVYD